MARRGDALHEHILDTAKLVFLESGFERTSMDTVAACASTSKRSLYAHFPTKDALFLACIDRSHQLFEGRLLAPSHYAQDPADAVARYCARFVQLLSYAPILQMCRIGITEAPRLPEAAARIYETFLGTATRGLATHLATHWHLDVPEATALAVRILGATVLPSFVGALFGLQELRSEVPDEAAIANDVNVVEMQRVVYEVLRAPAPAVHTRKAPTWREPEGF